MCDDKILDDSDEIPVLFTEDIDLLEDCLTDIILAMGLPEIQTNAVLRLISDTLEDHHANLLDTFESTLGDEDEEVEE